MIKNSVMGTAVKVWVRLLLASILSFIVGVSINAMGTGFFSEVVGYRIYEIDESTQSSHMIIEHIYTEGEDREAEIPLTDGQSILNLRETSNATNTAMGILSSIFTLLIFGIFPYNMLWNKGSHDENYVHMGRMESDAYFGLIVGLAASVPSAVLYVLLLLGKLEIVNGAIINWYRLLNPAFIPYIDAVKHGVDNAAMLSVGSLLALGVIILFVPIICAIGYALGYHQISLRERLVYRKKEKN